MIYSQVAGIFYICFVHCLLLIAVNCECQDKKDTFMLKSFWWSWIENSTYIWWFAGTLLSSDQYLSISTWESFPDDIWAGVVLLKGHTKTKKQNPSLHSSMNSIWTNSIPPTKTPPHLTKEKNQEKNIHKLRKRLNNAQVCQWNLIIILHCIQDFMLQCWV